MRRRLLTRVAAIGAALLTAGSLIGTAAPADAARPHTVKATAHHRTTVLLPTGEAVSYDPARPEDLRVHPRTASGLGHGWRAFQRSGHTYVAPVVALPFLGTVLDPSLFDVTALAKAGKRPAVTVAVTKGSKAAVPGLTVKKRSKSSQTGYFTAKGAKQFGAALQRAAVQARGSSKATRTLFGASSIGRGAAVKVLRPQYPQQTVVFTATGADGKPLPDGLMFYGDLDDSRRATDFAVIVDGEVRVSLPAGNYTLAAEAFTITSDTTADLHLLTDPALRVTGQKNQAVALDFRTATAQPSVAVPQAKTDEEFAFVYDREWPTGGFSDVIFGDPSLTVRLAPAAAPTIGTASLLSYFRSTPTSGAAEEYDAAFLQQGAIAADQSHTLAAADFADVHETVFDTGAAGPEAFGHGIALADGSGIGIFDPVDLPLSRTDHLHAPDGAFWVDGVITAPTELDPFDGEVDDGPRTYRAGTSTPVDWLRQTVAPAVPTFSDDQVAAGVYCPACRTSTQLVVATVPLQDSYGSGHFGFVADDETGQLLARTRLYRNGRIIDDESGSSFVVAPVPSGAADYRVVADSSPGTAGFTLGTVARTEWTFRSSSSTGAGLAEDVSCSADGKGTCRVLPLLRVSSPLPVALNGSMSVGTHAFPLCITGIQGAEVGTTAATAQVSFDNGRTFSDVPLTATGAGCWSAALTNPAGSGGAAAVVRITGTSSSGSGIVQTVRDAYRVAR